MVGYALAMVPARHACVRAYLLTTASSAALAGLASFFCMTWCTPSASARHRKPRPLVQCTARYTPVQ